MISSEKLFDRFDLFIESRYVYFLFFLFSFLIFSPFFIHGEFIVSTTDSVFGHYPNLLFGHEHFREGHIPLWNPYLFGGTDFTTSMHHHMLNPANWLLGLFPKKYALLGLTFIEFIEIALIGLFSFKAFLSLKASRMVSLASSLVVQLSGFTWFATATFIAVEFFFLSILFIYLIISYEKRRSLVSFIYMALLTAAMFMIGHVGYIAAFFFPVIGVQIFVHHKKLSVHLVFAGACLFGLAIGFYRIYPILAASSETVLSFIPPINYASNGYKLLSAFIPAVFGIDLGISATIFKEMSMDGHIQFHNLLYMGLPTAFFFILGLSGRFYSKISALSWIILLVVFGSLFMFQPATDLLYFLGYPFVHSIIFRVGGSFLIFAFFFLSLRKLYEDQIELPEKDLRRFLVFIGVTICAFITFYLHFALSFTGLGMGGYVGSRLLLTAVFILMVWAGIKFPLKISRIKIVNNWILPLLSFFFFSLMILIAWTSFFHRVQAPVFYHLSVILWSLSLLQLIRRDALSKKKVGMIVLALLFVIYSAAIQRPGEYRFSGGWIESIYPLMGLLTFGVLGFLVWEVFAHYIFKKIGKKTFVIFLSLLLVGDLLFFLKIYSYSGAPPFLKEEKLYPPLSQKRKEKFTTDPDLENFRVNHPGNYLIYPYHSAFSSAFMVYHARTIGGVDSLIQRPFLDFVGNFIDLDLPFYGRGMIFPGVNNKRLEELFGMKYSFPTTEKLEINERALSRFSAFTSYCVLPNRDKVIERLKGQDFKVDETLIIDQRIEGMAESQPLKCTPLSYESIGTDRIQLTLSQKEPRLVLFNDTFHEGWKATWNGKRVPIMVANGYFMAAPVPSGEGTLEFSFHPKGFLFLVKCSIGMLMILLALSIYAVKTKRY